MRNALQQLKDGLIVSCQAPLKSPLNRVEILAAFAEAAEQNGAAAVRVRGLETIGEVRRRVKIPVLGMIKNEIVDYEIRITPTRADAHRVASAGCELVALDATDRPRPTGEDLTAIIDLLRQEFDVAIVADVSSLEEGVAASELGVDAVATTLSGYTRDTRGRALPNFDLLALLACRLRIPVICEGGIHNPQQVRRAFDEGAYAVCVGRALTGLDWLVREYNAATPRMTQAPTESV